VKWASFAGVDQSTPVASSAAHSTASTTVTFGSTINYVTNGMTVVVAGNGGTPATGTLTATPAFTAGTATTTSAQTSRVFTTAMHTAAGSYASSTTVSWSGTTSTRSGLVVASLQPFTNQTLALSSLSLNPGSVTGGASSQGTVTLNAPAPSGGAVVTLSDNSSAAAVPASVTVPSGSTSATFTITTTSVSSSTTVTISAVYGGVTKTASLTVIPPVLYTVSGAISPAPSGDGATVTLTQGTTTVATVTAASDGTFAFPSVTNGTYTVTPAKAGFSFTPSSTTVTVNGANISSVNFTAAGLAIDLTTSTDRGTAASSIATSAFTTRAGNELLLAFVSTDATGATPNVSVTGVTGGGLAWTLVKRTNAQFGTAEIWRAFATTTVTNATVTATLSQSIPASITVMAFAGVNATTPIGATGGASGASGPPTASLTTQGTNSWVFAVGNDYYGNAARTPGTNQTMVHQYLVTTPGIVDAFWVQRQNATVQPAGTLVTINDTAPTTDGWNMSIVEIRQ